MSSEYVAQSLPQLETARLILRPPMAEDFQGWCEFSADAETMKHLGGPVSAAIAWRQFCTMAGAWQIRGYAMFSVLLKESGQWIGRVGPWYPEGWPGREVGWGIMSRYTGHGYALEAARASMDYAFDVLGWDEVIHTIDPDNHASIALARRLGSENLGSCTMPAPYESYSVDKYGQSRAEWQQNRNKIQANREGNQP